jgi:DNA mismatch endonuclease (patch repair protein)
MNNSHGPTAIRQNRGDIMSAQQRSALMARIKGTNTGPERMLARALRRHGLRPSRNVRSVPGRPDFAFCRLRIAVFVDGDFWHGWRFQTWRLKLTPAWEHKIATNMRRDRRIHRALRRCGWTVIRIWEHQLFANPSRCVKRIIEAYRAAKSRAKPGDCRTKLV